LDLSMPDMDGASTLAILRTYPTTRETPVVICTAYPDLLGTREIEYSALVEKPCVPREVMKAVAEVLGDPAPASAR
ncbi:MAG TPA: hypothetical protein VHS09_02500, partial [Polyangiaceae bacterium]|nr:hypothetical protein [Polyangiaceae bacterium]